MSVRSLRMGNPNALHAGAVQELFSRAFKKDEHADAEAAWEWCYEFIRDDRVAIFVAANDENELIGLAICAHMLDVWTPDPFVLHFHSEGLPALHALIEDIRKWALSMGATHIRCVNQTGHSDEAHMRAMKPAAEGKAIGSVIVYALKERDE